MTDEKVGWKVLYPDGANLKGVFKHEWKSNGF